MIPHIPAMHVGGLRIVATDPQEAEATFAIALSLARGSYQRGLIYGSEAWSGASLKGRAANYGGRYHASRCALLTRLRAAGLSTVRYSDRLAHNRIRVLVWQTVAPKN